MKFPPFLFPSPTQNQNPFLKLLWRKSGHNSPSFTFLKSATVFVGAWESIALPVESARGQLLNGAQSPKRKKSSAYTELFQRLGSASIKNSILEPRRTLMLETRSPFPSLSLSILSILTRRQYSRVLSMHTKYYVMASYMTLGQRAG